MSPTNITELQAWVAREQAHSAVVMDNVKADANTRSIGYGLHSAYEAVAKKLTAVLWQPIASAPENTHVLIAFPEYGVGLGMNVASAALYDGDWKSSPGDEMCYFEPTHWMPLPAAPPR